MYKFIYVCMYVYICMYEEYVLHVCIYMYKYI